MFCIAEFLDQKINDSSVPIPGWNYNTSGKFLASKVFKQWFYAKGYPIISGGQKGKKLSQLKQEPSILVLKFSLFSILLKIVL